MESVQVNNAQPKTRALSSPALDFWMLGGGSIIVLLLALSLPPLWGSMPSWSSTPQHLLVAGTLLVTYPHFIFSYLLFYPNFFTRLRSPETEAASKVRLLVSGIAVPIALIVLLTVCYVQPNENLLILLLFLSNLLTGWHYSKQGYGALITLSVYKNSFYNAREKIILNVNTYSVWIFTWALATNAAVARPADPAAGPQFDILTVPKWALLSLGAVAALATLGAAVVFAKKFLANRKNFSVSGMLAYIASLYLWTALFREKPWAFFVIIPVFHSLQYLFFVWKFKTGEFAAALKARAMEAAGPDGKTSYNALIFMILFLLTGFSLGFIFLSFLPQKMDDLYPLPGGQVFFFLIAVQIFFNIHHYFMDHAFWRRDNTKVQKYLFKAGE